jgi:hypothetical protein
MPQVAIIVTIEVSPGRRDQLLPLLCLSSLKKMRQGNPTIQVLVPDDADTKVLVRVYRDEAAFRSSKRKIDRAISRTLLE